MEEDDAAAALHLGFGMLHPGLAVTVVAAVGLSALAAKAQAKREA